MELFSLFQWPWKQQKCPHPTYLPWRHAKNCKLGWKVCFNTLTNLLKDFWIMAFFVNRKQNNNKVCINVFKMCFWHTLWTWDGRWLDFYLFRSGLFNVCRDLFCFDLKLKNKWYKSSNIYHISYFQRKLKRKSQRTVNIWQDKS